MERQTTDRRILRTKRLIRDALTELIEEKGFERVTICDLTSRADINRGTFYAHYRDKNDLLQQSENEIVADILDIAKGLRTITIEDILVAYRRGVPLPFAVALYDYIRENGRFVKTLMSPTGDPAFAPRLREILAKNLIENVLTKKYRDNPAALTEYYLAFYTSAQLGVMQLWLEKGMQETSEEMALIVMGIMFMRPGEAIELGTDAGMSS